MENRHRYDFVRARFFRKSDPAGVIVTFQESSVLGELEDDFDVNALKKAVVASGDRKKGEPFRQITVEVMRERLFPGG
jgi:hypothetical protein